ncbi:glycosyltransferase family protein [Lachnospiraceae bacterium ZAX-1]
MVNDWKFCFIICTNHVIYEKECIHYIKALRIPENYEIEIVCIKGAISMTSGYTEAMEKTDAKYKIYLHQDVFIVNQNILYDILKLFEDKTIGMIGVVGFLEFNRAGVMWEGERVGMLYTNTVVVAKGALFGEIEDDYCKVEAIDGLMMITQFDLPWRKDLFDKWDFYDISQSAEFRRKGYSIVVPQTTLPWCIHDDGFLNMEYYYGEREKYIKEYSH